MSPDERTEAETRADRALRRGDLGAALALYEAIARAWPSDLTIADKLARIHDTLQPAELTHAKARVTAVEPASAAADSELDQAEARAARGDFAGAIATYRQALAHKPDSELIKERLGELFMLAQASAPRSSPRPPTPRATSTEPKAAPDVLADLLARISDRRR